MPKKGGKRKKTKTHSTGAPEGAIIPDAQAENIPRSIVAKVGKVSPLVKGLIQDIRRVMGPYTAMNLKERKYNRMKDYASVATQLSITHLMVFSQTENNVILRVARHPDGPTLHFRVQQFMPSKLVKASQKRPYESEAAFHTSPVLVLNNFNQSDEQHVKLMKVTFQHMFRTINVNTVKLGDCRRVVLYHYLPETGQVEMRHYAIRASPVGISRNVKKIIQSKIPDLSNLEDISEFVEGNAGGFGSVSDSEAEEEGSRVTLPERYVGRGNAKAQLSAMKLVELGPRLTMELFKVEQGVNEGDILYHKFVHKTPEEAAAIKARIERERALKEQRRRVQEENVKRKRDAKEEKKKLREERKKRRLEGGDAERRGDDDEEEEDDDDEEDEEEEDDDDEEDEEEEEEEEEEGEEGDYQENDYDLDEEIGEDYEYADEDDDEEDDEDEEEDGEEDDEEDGDEDEVEFEDEEEEEDDDDDEE